MRTQFIIGKVRLPEFIFRKVIKGDLIPHWQFALLFEDDKRVMEVNYIDGIQMVHLSPYDIGRNDVRITELLTHQIKESIRTWNLKRLMRQLTKLRITPELRSKIKKWVLFERFLVTANSCAKEGLSLIHI